MNLDKVYGNQDIKDLISTLMDLKEGSKPQFPGLAFLFCGPSGTGKTTMANAVAEQVVESDESTLSRYINCADKNGVEFVRDLIATVHQRAVHKTHVYIFDEAHRFTANAWDAMLVFLEALPDNTVLMFCTTRIKNIPDTILSRLFRCEFRPDDEVLTKICKDFGVADQYIKPALRSCGGNARVLKQQLKTGSFGIETPDCMLFNFITGYKELELREFVSQAQSLTNAYMNEKCDISILLNDLKDILSSRLMLFEQGLGTEELFELTCLYFDLLTLAKDDYTPTLDSSVYIVLMQYYLDHQLNDQE